MSTYTEIFKAPIDVKSSEISIGEIVKIAEITTTDIPALIDDFNSRVRSGYKANCDPDGKCLLIDTKLPGYANLIYWFYSDGTVAYKRGGLDYSKQYGNSEIKGEESIVNSCRLGFKFELENKSICSTYAILPVVQVIEFRKEMEQIIQLAEKTGYFKPIDTVSLIEELNVKVIQTHESHYDEAGKHKLIKNLDVYHLYSDGTITYQKGGNIYNKRNEWDYLPSISGSHKYPFKFVNESGDYTYGILTREECREFRNEMLRLVLLFTNSK
jgi:hypothetical protein